jgi:hypothetical protein
MEHDGTPAFLILPEDPPGKHAACDGWQHRADVREHVERVRVELDETYAASLRDTLSEIRGDVQRINNKMPVVGESHTAIALSELVRKLEVGEEDY